MKTFLRTLPVLTLAFAVTFAACKKEEKKQTTDPASEVLGHTDDQTNISTQIDALADDANTSLESNTYFGGRVNTTTNSLCGAVAVADTVSNPKKITITYNGANCANTYTRTGVVVLSIPAGVRWKNAGAAITASIQNLRIKRLIDGKTVAITGTQTLTNVSGGLLYNLSNLSSIVHTLTSDNMSITFDDNTQRTWHIAHKRVFTYNNGIVLTASGTGTTGSSTNAVEWGTNRFGHSFVTSITQPLVFRQDCGSRLTAGEIKHEGFATATVTFGLNAGGTPTSCPGTGNYYFKLVWTGPAGNSVSAVLPY